MVYHGTVQNGVVVIDPQVALPEGAPVVVHIVETGAMPSTQVGDDALLRMSELAIDAGVRDLSVNLDHYLYGHPKVDGK